MAFRTVSPMQSSTAARSGSPTLPPRFNRSISPSDRATSPNDSSRLRPCALPALAKRSGAHVDITDSFSPGEYNAMRNQMNLEESAPLELWKKGYTTAQLEAKGYSVLHLRGLLGRERAKLLDLVQAGWTYADLLNAGYTTRQILDAGYAGDEVSATDQTLMQAVEEIGVAGDLRAAADAQMRLMGQGYSYGQVQQSASTLANLLDAGYTLDELKLSIDGDRGIDFREAGYTAAQINETGRIWQCVDSDIINMPLNTWAYSAVTLQDALFERRLMADAAVECRSWALEQTSAKDFELRRRERKLGASLDFLGGKRTKISYGCEEENERIYTHEVRTTGDVDVKKMQAHIGKLSVDIQSLRADMHKMYESRMMEVARQNDTLTKEEVRKMIDLQTKEVRKDFVEKVTYTAQDSSDSLRIRDEESVVIRTLQQDLQEEKAIREKELRELRIHFDNKYNLVEDSQLRAATVVREEITLGRTGLESFRGLVDGLFANNNNRFEELSLHLEELRKTAQEGLTQLRKELAISIDNLKINELREQVKIEKSGYLEMHHELRERVEKHSTTTVDRHESVTAELKELFEGFRCTMHDQMSQFYLDHEEKHSKFDVELSSLREAFEHGRESHSSHFTELVEEIEMISRNMLEMTSLRLQVAALLQTEIEPLKETLGKHIASSMAQEEVLSMFESQRAYLYGEFEQLRVEIAQEADRRNSIVCLIQDSLDKEREMREFSMSECMMNIRTELSQVEEVRALRDHFERISAEIRIVSEKNTSLTQKIDGKDTAKLELLIQRLTDDLSHLREDVFKECRQESSRIGKKFSELDGQIADIKQSTSTMSHSTVFQTTVRDIVREYMVKQDTTGKQDWAGRIEKVEKSIVEVEHSAERSRLDMRQSLEKKIEDIRLASFSIQAEYESLIVTVQELASKADVNMQIIPAPAPMSTSHAEVITTTTGVEDWKADVEGRLFEEVRSEVRSWKQRPSSKTSTSSASSLTDRLAQWKTELGEELLEQIQALRVEFDQDRLALVEEVKARCTAISEVMTRIERIDRSPPEEHSYSYSRTDEKNIQIEILRREIEILRQQSIEEVGVNKASVKLTSYPAEVTVPVRVDLMGSKIETQRKDRIIFEPSRRPLEESGRKCYTGLGTYEVVDVERQVSRGAFEGNRGTLESQAASLRRELASFRSPSSPQGRCRTIRGESPPRAATIRGESASFRSPSSPQGRCQTIRGESPPRAATIRGESPPRASTVNRQSPGLNYSELIRSSASAESGAGRSGLARDRKDIRIRLRSGAGFDELKKSYTTRQIMDAGYLGREFNATEQTFGDLANDATASERNRAVATIALKLMKKKLSYGQLLSSASALGVLVDAGYTLDELKLAGSCTWTDTNATHVALMNAEYTQEEIANHVRIWEHLESEDFNMDLLSWSNSLQQLQEELYKQQSIEA